MKSENKLVKEALSFLGWGLLTGSAKSAFEKCETTDFSCCAHHFDDELSQNLIQLEGLIHGN